MSERELHRYLSADIAQSEALLDRAAAAAPTPPNTLWYTEARVQELLREKDVQIASLQRLLALRTEALNRVVESNEMLRAQQRVN